MCKGSCHEVTEGLSKQEKQPLRHFLAKMPPPLTQGRLAERRHKHLTKPKFNSLLTNNLYCGIIIVPNKIYKKLKVCVFLICKKRMLYKCMLLVVFRFYLAIKGALCFLCVALCHAFFNYIIKTHGLW